MASFKSFDAPTMPFDLRICAADRAEEHEFLVVVLQMATFIAIDIECFAFHIRLLLFTGCKGSCFSGNRPYKLNHEVVMRDAAGGVKKLFDDNRRSFEVFLYFCALKKSKVPMCSKTNKFPTEKTKKPPIEFGGFGNLFKHTHTHTHTHILTASRLPLFTSLLAGDNLRLFLLLGKGSRFALFPENKQ